MHEEGDKCLVEGCQGRVQYPKIENCLCHIAAPCHACVEKHLVCNECGDIVPGEAPSHNSSTPPDLWKEWRESYERAHEQGTMLPSGARVFRVKHAGRSGSTHVITGEYEGNLTEDELIAHYGTGTFGHRRPMIAEGRFNYTKITD